MPVGLAEDLPSRELAVVRDPDLVRNRLRGQLGLRLADKADLGNRVDAEREAASVIECASTPHASQDASRPCSADVEARLGKPITSPTA